jgi:hypothetical protein
MAQDGQWVKRPSTMISSGFSGFLRLVVMIGTGMTAAAIVGALAGLLAGLFSADGGITSPILFGAVTMAWLSATPAPIGATGLTIWKDLRGPPSAMLTICGGAALGVAMPLLFGGGLGMFLPLGAICGMAVGWTMGRAQSLV